MPTHALLLKHVDDHSSDGELARTLVGCRARLDSVIAEVSGLQKRLGAGDRTKLGEYLQSVREIEKRISSPKGDPDNVLTRPELEDKALWLAQYAGAASEQEMRQIIARVWRLRDEKDVRDFLRAG